jgi:hypothetical protein
VIPFVREFILSVPIFDIFQTINVISDELFSSFFADFNGSLLIEPSVYEISHKDFYKKILGNDTFIEFILSDESSLIKKEAFISMLLPIFFNNDANLIKKVLEI